MLPGGLLSKHGYTRKWGFFSGVCAGSGHFPFETHTDRIAGAVAGVEQTIAEVNAEIAELENLDSEVNGKPEAWHHTYKAYGGYVWERVPVGNLDHKVYGDRTCYSAEITVASGRKPEPRQEQIQAHDAAWNLPTLRHWVHFLNCKYAKHLRQQNSARRDWVKWQQQRLADWSVKPLTLREGK